MVDIISTHEYNYQTNILHFWGPHFSRKEAYFGVLRTPGPPASCGTVTMIVCCVVSDYTLFVHHYDHYRVGSCAGVRVCVCALWMYYIVRTLFMDIL